MTLREIEALRDETISERLRYRINHPMTGPDIAQALAIERATVTELQHPKDGYVRAIMKGHRSGPAWAHRHVNARLALARLRLQLVRHTAAAWWIENAPTSKASIAPLGVDVLMAADIAAGNTDQKEVQ